MKIICSEREFVPYFTNENNGKISAVYSGRFAFILPDELANLKDRFDKSVGNRDRIAGEHVGESPKQVILDEEFEHSRDFCRSYFGNTLNGMRWLLRQFFIYFPFPWPVQAYYKLRFIWFALAYDLLEENAKKIQTEREKKNPSTPHEPERVKIRALLQVDLSVMKAMREMVPLEFGIFILVSPLCFLLGYILTRHFTIFVYATDHRRIVEHGRTKYTSSTVEHKDMTRFDRFARFAISLMQHEWMLTKRPWLQTRWVVLKFRAEYAMYSNHPSLMKGKRVFAEWEEYIEVILRFSLLWSNMESSQAQITLQEYVDELAISDEAPPPEECREMWDAAVIFFYYHGN